MAELMNEWSLLKSGSDIRGIATKLSDTDEITLTNVNIEKIIFGFLLLLKNASGLNFSQMTVAVGYDTRLSSDRIKIVAIQSLRSLGVTVYDCGISTTPSMYTAIKILSCTASIEITASHQPANYNGMKFFTINGGLSEDDIQMILEVAQSAQFQKIFKQNGMFEDGEVKEIRILDYYSSNIRKKICDTIGKKEEDKPLSGLKIVVDAGGGVGGFFVEEVLKPLGADVSGSVFLEPDGNFSNHMPNPEDPSAMESLKRATLAVRADIGIVFDTDVDRVAFVDEKGEEINRNKLIALASEIVLREHPGASIVTDSVTSDFLKLFIEERDGIHVKFKRGYHNVITAAKNLNSGGADCQLAIETSGHAAFRENNFIDDGAYLAAKIIIRLIQLKQENKNFGDILDDLKTEKEYLEIRLPIITRENEYSNIQKLFSHIKNSIKNVKSCEVDDTNVDGLRLKFNSHWQNGWCLLRKSIHEPVLVLFLESYISNGISLILSTIKPIFEKFDFFVDTSLLSIKK